MGTALDMGSANVEHRPLTDFPQFLLPDHLSNCEILLHRSCFLANISLFLSFVHTEGKRPWLEPPVPGYLGFIPRINTTELGLGGRYHVTTGDGLKAFKAEKDFHESTKKKPIDLTT